MGLNIKRRKGTTMEPAKTKTVHVKITGRGPMLMHSDSIEWADKMEVWKNDPNNKKLSKAGDDRTPPWRWLGALYYDEPEEGIVVIPSENVMKAIMQGAALVPTGKGQKTFKEASQSGLICQDFYWPLKINGKTLSMKTLQKFRKLETFKEHLAAAVDNHFRLDYRRVRIGKNKHIRVRPRFDGWSIEGTIIIVDTQITIELVRTILELAGKYKGLCDWRPSSPTPGTWGLFDVEVS
jgi:hypothetical protein